MQPDISNPRRQQREYPGKQEAGRIAKMLSNNAADNTSQDGDCRVSTLKEGEVDTGLQRR